MMMAVGVFATIERHQASYQCFLIMGYWCVEDCQTRSAKVRPHVTLLYIGGAVLCGDLLLWRLPAWVFPLLLVPVEGPRTSGWGMYSKSPGPLLLETPIRNFSKVLVLL